jgi:hypothetical protein
MSEHDFIPKTYEVPRYCFKCEVLITGKCMTCKSKYLILICCTIFNPNRKFYTKLKLTFKLLFNLTSKIDGFVIILFIRFFNFQTILKNHQ